MVFETDRALTALTARSTRCRLSTAPAYRDVTAANTSARPASTPSVRARRRQRASARLIDARPFPRGGLDLAFVTRRRRAARRAAAGRRRPGVRARRHRLGILERRPWLPLARREDETLALTRDGHVRLQAAAAGQPGRATHDRRRPTCRATGSARACGQSAYEIPPRLLAVRANTRGATEAQTIAARSSAAATAGPTRCSRPPASPSSPAPWCSRSTRAKAS